MAAGEGMTILKNAHLVDPALGIDRVADLTIADGRIAAIGAAAAVAGAETIDLAGSHVSAGWIDLHVHAYGTLGFGDIDSIGVCQGVTTLVDAGGPGLKTMDEFLVLSKTRLQTALYAGPYIYPMGIVGLSYVENQSDVADLRNYTIAEWKACVDEHPGLVRYVKCGAYSPQGRKPIEVAKTVSSALGLPLYLHIGEYHFLDGRSPIEDGFDVVQKGDMVTHLYHGNKGQVIDDAGKVLPFVRAAQRRGVLFDIGFGGYNWSWDVAEKCFAQDLVPHIISSDLQQFNVMGPCISLAHVMSIHLRLGMSLAEVITAVTSAPAAALSLADKAGSLRVGAPADLTVFRLEDGDFALADCHMKSRQAERRFLPVMAFKDGRRIDSDLTRAQDERNWFMAVAEDRPPAPAAALSRRQRNFLAALARRLDAVEWGEYEASRIDLRKAMELKDAFHQARRGEALPLRDALDAVYDSFLSSPFPMQIGLFLIRLDRRFALERMNEVAGQRSMVEA